MKASLTDLTNRVQPYRPVIENLILALWVVGVVTLTLNHELWRDEVRSINLVRDISSFPEFIAMAKYDGHPILWRLVLELLYEVLPHPVVLQVASLLIGFLTVWLFIKYAPLPLWIKTLFIFGVVPFGTNAVMARDYGITMLLFFVFALLITQRKQRPLLVGLVLCLAANTNSYGMYMSGLFLGYWIVESGFGSIRDYRYVTAVFLVGAGIIFSHWSTRVDAETVFVTPEFMARIDWFEHAVKAVLRPGEYIGWMLALDPIYRHIFIIVLIAGLMAVSPWLGLTVLASVILFNVVGGAIIFPKLRHQGVLLGFIMTAYWLAQARLSRPDRLPWHTARSVIYHVALIGFFVPFMVHNIGHMKRGFSEELAVQKSSAMALGHYIEANVQLQDFIIIGEPDYALQTIAYYTDNPIYLARERKFSTFVKYSKEYQTPMTLSELLRTAKELHADYRVPVLIVLALFEVSEQSPRTFDVGYRGLFEMSADDIRAFESATLKLAEFNNALGDEDYQLFLYAERENLDRYRDKYMNLR